jgi:superfamily II DNA or RNA helicase
MITIEIEDYKQWESGLYLISAGTGQGKSWWVTNELYEYACEQGKHIIMLTNRVILREQMEKDLQGKDIAVMSYQKQEFNHMACELPHLFGNPENLMDFLERFDYLVLDEAHYIFQDARFNYNTETIFEIVKKFSLKKVVIMLSATPELLIKECNRQDIPLSVYNFGADYSYVKKMYAYSKKETVREIIGNIPQDEKIMFFGSNKKRLEELREYYLSVGEQVAYVCADNRARNAVVAQIIENQKFDCRILFSTQVLDNGINIRDRQVKHIIIEMYDLVDFIQCLGRKRAIDNTDTITLYFLDYSHRLTGICNSLKKDLDIYDVDYKQMPKEEFDIKYRTRKLPAFFDNLSNPIWPAVVKAKDDYEYMNTIVTGERSFCGYISEKLGKNICWYEAETKEAGLTTFLKQHMGIALYKKERNNIISAINIKRNGRTLKSPSMLNSFLQDSDIPYVIEVHRDVSKKRPVYWTIENRDG